MNSEKVSAECSEDSEALLLSFATEGLKFIERLNRQFTNSLILVFVTASCAFVATKDIALPAGRTKVATPFIL